MSAMDAGFGADGIGMGVQLGANDAGRVFTSWTVSKYDAAATRYVEQALWSRRDATPTPEDFKLLVKPYAVNEIAGNVITTAGWTRILNLMGGLGGTAFNSTNCRIGVGTGTTPAEAAADTDLIGVVTTNRYWKLVSGAPVVTLNAIAYTAIFGTAVANIAWNEFGLDNGTADGAGAVTAPFLNHKVGIAQGTKLSSQTWTATATLTFT